MLVLIGNFRYGRIVYLPWSRSCPNFTHVRFLTFYHSPTFPSESLYICLIPLLYYHTRPSHPLSPSCFPLCPPILSLELPSVADSLLLSLHVCCFLLGSLPDGPSIDSICDSFCVIHCQSVCC